MLETQAEILKELEDLKKNKVEKTKEFDPTVKHILGLINTNKGSARGLSPTLDTFDVTTEGDGEFWLSCSGNCKITQEMIDNWNHAKDLGQKTAQNLED
jgi:hypothetical protein